MNVLIVNPIIYTSETKEIHRAKSIKDTMIYDLCITFKKKGHNITLFAGDVYKPITNEGYPFNIVWGCCKYKKIFMPHCFPYMSNLVTYIKNNKDKFDLIISSEIFSVNTLILGLMIPKKLVIWHELAKHNNIGKKIPSLIWYNIVTRIFFRKCLVIPRSEEAKNFIKKYCKNTINEIIDHGVNIEKFIACKNKEYYFVVCSQLIERKQIDGIIDRFKQYIQKYNGSYILYIIGNGNSAEKLKYRVRQLNIEDKVIFLGKLNHENMIPYLSKSQALLVNTIKDNNMISIVEAISVGTPIITTEIPYNVRYIKEFNLGIVNNHWTCEDLEKIISKNKWYVQNCLDYRNKLSTEYKVDQFTEIYQKYIYNNSF